MENLYYQPPRQEVFEEVKEKAMLIWSEKSNVGGYSSGKINAIKDLTNVKGNLMYIVSMFDLGNQIRLAGELTMKSNHEIYSRIKSGGGDDRFNPFRSPTRVMR
jgi:hypothetical protein